MKNIICQRLIKKFFPTMKNTIILKIASMDTIINDLKSIDDFHQYFQEMSFKDKEELKKLEERYKKNEFDKTEYHRLQDCIENKYYSVTNMCREFYMFQNFRNQVDSTRYIYCECIMVEERSSHKQITLAAFYDAGTDGNISYDKDMYHEIKEKHLIDYCNDMINPGVELIDASYFASKEGFYSNFNDIKEYVEKKRGNRSNEKIEIK